MADDTKTSKEQRAEDRAAAKEAKELAAADAEGQAAADAAADHFTEMERDAVAEKADISEKAAGARADISDAEAAAHAEVDAKVEKARPEEDKVSPEQRHEDRLAELRDIRARALQASRQMDHFAMGQAVHDTADLLHRFFEERQPRLVDPLESELVGHHRAPVRK